MRSLFGIPVFLALAAAFSQPAAACEPQEATAGHSHSATDSTTTSCVTLDHVMAGEMSISGAWARAMLPGQRTGSGYLTLENKGAQADRLVSVSSEAAARVELHSMKVVDDVMVMRPIEDGLEIGAGDTVEFKPGGMHLMFLDPEGAFAEGDAIAVTLTFERSGSVDVELPVMKAGAAASGHSTHHTH